MAHERLRFFSQQIRPWLTANPRVAHKRLFFFFSQQIRPWLTSAYAFFFLQLIRLSIFENFRYNQLILSIVIECYRFSILSISQAGIKSKRVLIDPSTVFSTFDKDQLVKIYRHC